jgi:antirestriction protein
VTDTNDLVPKDVKAAYCRLHGEDYWSEEHCEESYEIQFPHYQEAVDYIMEQWWECIDTMPAYISCYIDEDAVLRDLLIDTYDIESDSDEAVYVFRKV